MAHVRADVVSPVPALTLYASGAHLGIILTCYQVFPCLMTLEAVQQSACHLKLKGGPGTDRFAAA